MIAAFIVGFSVGVVSMALLDLWARCIETRVPKIPNCPNIPPPPPKSDRPNPAL